MKKNELTPTATETTDEPFGMQFLETLAEPTDIVGGNLSTSVGTYTWIFFADTRTETDCVEA
jgi:hypothetical protein